LPYEETLLFQPKRLAELAQVSGLNNGKKNLCKPLDRCGNTSNYFCRFARWSARASGRPFTFGLAIFVIVVWAVTGPIFGFSDTWQLVINTGTTIVTFLMVFLIQNAQNRDSQAIQLKLNELLRSVKGAHTALLDIEELSEGELDVLKREYEDLASSARKALRNGQTDEGCPQVRVNIPVPAGTTTKEP